VKINNSGMGEESLLTKKIETLSVIITNTLFLLTTKTCQITIKKIKLLLFAMLILQIQAPSKPVCLAAYIRNTVLNSLYLNHASIIVVVNVSNN